jgi:hypothetical protein
MKTIQLIFLLLFQSTLVFSQAAKVYLEGEQNTISTEISALEKRKTELTAAKREFITAKDLRSEYYDLSLKAMETGDPAYVDKANQKLKEAKELLEKSFAKWNAYHTENRIPKNIIDQSNYTHLLLTINDLLTEEKIAAQKTGCCGPDIVEIHLVPQNVISPVNNNSEKNDFWVTGELDTQFSDSVSSLINIRGRQYDLSKFNYKFHVVSNVEIAFPSYWKTDINLFLGLFPPGISENEISNFNLNKHNEWGYNTRTYAEHNKILVALELNESYAAKRYALSSVFSFDEFIDSPIKTKAAILRNIGSIGNDTWIVSAMFENSITVGEFKNNQDSELLLYKMVRGSAPSFYTVSSWGKDFTANITDYCMQNVFNLNENFGINIDKKSFLEEFMSIYTFIQNDSRIQKIMSDLFLKKSAQDSEEALQNKKEDILIKLAVSTQNYFYHDDIKKIKIARN